MHIVHPSLNTLFSSVVDVFDADPDPDPTPSSTHSGKSLKNVLVLFKAVPSTLFDLSR